MKFNCMFGLMVGLLLFISCNGNDDQPSSRLTIRDLVDNAHIQVERASLSYREVIQIDHHRMAEKTGVYTPPAIVNIFADDSEIISKLVAKNQRVAMDLPFKILAYSEPDTVAARIRFTSAEFLKRRHGLSDDDVSEFKRIIDNVIEKFPSKEVVKPDLSTLNVNYGVIQVESIYGFNETMERIHKVLSSPKNLDTRVFTQIDFQKDAESHGIIIRPTFLWLFGAPKPGGMAMHNAPAIGLDAFCQKLLVYLDENGNVQVCFSDMAEFSKLYYSYENKAQKIVSNRMKQAFTESLSK